MSMTADELAKRQAIIDACRRMNALGINQGTSGNISVRHVDGLLVTPTSVPYEAMTPDQIVFTAMDGAHAPDQKPSSEWRFHRDILESRPDVNAVVHAHPTYWLAVEVEPLARQDHGCLQIGQPPLLPSDEIERVRRRMAGYGLSEG
ncbi:MULTISPECIES: class II aldolase/adducin family protein [Bradyrhizobium]|jgi:ribulose-5-phosphate 4-epimerase/fuculose-1-phosphate aldolase|uniref:class II aldolase/adducin family protein n=1 Tax=Bradyrhizobium TaxID=374 RepID=UPI00293F6D7C|nr:class II aldolase/adducin family protein [Bradyrhizobium sp. NDS-1]WOH75216.1 class II aldolase/adducin family protein [Bradyrhizobium sp. NDS-1]